MQSIIKLCEQKCPEQFQALFASTSSPTTVITLTNADLSAEASNEEEAEPQTGNNTGASTDTLTPTAIILIVISGILLCVALALVMVILYMKMWKPKRSQRILPSQTTCAYGQVNCSVFIVISNMSKSKVRHLHYYKRHKQ